MTTVVRAAAQTRDHHYFAGIEGMRAIAVLSVLAFHLNGVVPSGFVGVDIFFCISGFVVASASASLPTANLRSFLAGFYARRLLRIAPALIVCLVVTFVATVLFVPDAWLSASNYATGFAAFAGFSNLVLAYNANDYWSPRVEFNPFTHTWSLGVEEQFYLLSPLLFYVWLRASKPRAMWALALLAALSLGFAVLHARSNSGVLAFYSLHTRFWELALGVSLFFTLDRWRPLLSKAPDAATESLGFLSLAGIALSLIVVDGQRFPWPGALLPTVCSGLLICSVVASPSTLVGRVLASKPASWVGKRSYSLYLWHWPVFVLARWTTGLETLQEQIAACLLTVALAAGSFAFVELPIRYSQTGRRLRRARVIALGISTLALGFGAAGALAVARPWISLSVTRDRATWTAIEDVAGKSEPCELKTRSERLSVGTVQFFEAVGCKGSDRTIFVAGDSHASAYTAMLKRHARATGDRIILLSTPGCGVFGLRTPMRSDPPPCWTFAQSALRLVLQQAKPHDVLFLPSLRLRRLRDQWGGLHSLGARSMEDREAAVKEAIDLLSPLGINGITVLLEAPKPLFKAPPFRCSDWFNADNPVCDGGMDIPRAQIELLREPVIRQMKLIEARVPNAKMWDPMPSLCPEVTCRSFHDGKPLFFDGDHLSGFGNARLLPSFEAALKATN